MIRSILALTCALTIFVAWLFGGYFGLTLYFDLPGMFARVIVLAGLFLLGWLILHLADRAGILDIKDP